MVDFLSAVGCWTARAAVVVIVIHAGLMLQLLIDVWGKVSEDTYFTPKG